MEDNEEEMDREKGREKFRRRVWKKRGGRRRAGLELRSRVRVSGNMKARAPDNGSKLF